MGFIWKTTQTPLSNENGSQSKTTISEYIIHTAVTLPSTLYHIQEETQ